MVSQNFATGVLERLGLSYDVLKASNPQVILASVSGYGQTGPYREYMGYCSATGPLSGLASSSGLAGEGPEETGVAMPDPTAGITAAYTVAAALLRRDETGIGEQLDVTLWEATAALNLDGWMEYALRGTQAERIGNRDPWMAPHRCFPAAGDDEWMTTTCTDEGFAELADIASRPQG
ncbi:MAG: CoA transferase [Gammaproteobacteria bacterium]|nr:CoA transferase [Gammaproteobacteria bacterium]